MHQFLRRFGTTEKPTINGKIVWVAASRSAEERLKGRHLEKHKKAMIEAKVVQPENIRVDYGRGLLMVRHGEVFKRTGEWKENSESGGSVELDEEKMKMVGITAGKGRHHRGCEGVAQRIGKRQQKADHGKWYHTSRWNACS